MNTETDITLETPARSELKHQGTLNSGPRPRFAESRPPPERMNGSNDSSADAREGTHQIEVLIERIESLPDTEARELLHECLQSTLAFYGEGLGRIVQLTKNAGPAGQKVMDALAQDNLVRSLLLIHGLHPQSLEARLRGALDKVRPYLESHGGNVEFISLHDEVARLRLQGTCKSCPSSSVTLELAVRQAIEEACPDLLDFEVEGLAPSSGSPIPRGPNAAQWTVIENFAPLNPGHLRSLQVDGVTAMICNLNGNLYAYRNRCATCASALDTGTLSGNVLCCHSGHRFDVQHAGVSLDDANVHLDPLPLLAVNGSVKIAMRAES
jgi:Fe-S cluster biogenesis protein NfuA/nitrite reductase/ring-hydroxylating ferredoxin subunit